MKIIKQIDFFVGYLKKQNQPKTANFIETNKNKIAYYFNKLNKNIKKCYCFFSIGKDKIYIHFRSDKEQPFRYYFIYLDEIENIEIEQIENSNYKIPKLERI